MLNYNLVIQTGADYNYNNNYYYYFCKMNRMWDFLSKQVDMPENVKEVGLKNTTYIL